MRRAQVRHLRYDHRVVIHGHGDPRADRPVEAAAPLTKDGIHSYVRWRDANGERYAFVVSTGAAVEHGGNLLCQVRVETVDGAQRVWRSSDPRRLREAAVRYASLTDPGWVRSRNVLR